jgi:predicted ribosomally synthesized peptide with nif11-like leader
MTSYRAYRKMVLLAFIVQPMFWLTGSWAAYSSQFDLAQTAPIQDQYEDQITKFIAKIQQDPLLQQKLLATKADPIAIAKEYGFTIKSYHILGIASLGNELTIPLEEQLQIHFSSNPDFPVSSRLIYLFLGEQMALYYYLSNPGVLGRI